MARKPHEIEEWIGVWTRIVGIVLGIALVTATIFGKAGIDFAGAYVFVTGLIFAKNVISYRLPQERGEDDRGESYRDRP